MAFHKATLRATVLPEDAFLNTMKRTLSVSRPGFPVITQILKAIQAWNPGEARVLMLEHLKYSMAGTRTYVQGSESDLTIVTTC